MASEGYTEEGKSIHASKVSAVRIGRGGMTYLQRVLNFITCVWCGVLVSHAP